MIGRVGGPGGKRPFRPLTLLNLRKSQHIETIKATSRASTWNGLDQRLFIMLLESVDPKRN